MNTLKNEFSITAKTCTLKCNNQNEGGIILDGKIKYVIPIYQRPYCWTEDQICKFINDIFYSFWGSEKKPIKEPFFIGTMQLTERNGEQQNIIDGQQRLSTFFVLFKILKHIFPEIKDLQDTPLNWLNTRVSNGIQQSYLEDLINSDLSQCNDSQNPYLKNALLVKEMIEEELKGDEGNAIEFNVSEFLEYLFNNIYFVVIETKAGLSKTLQIFNAINTTGLDLNGGDIFKLRMFEYLEKKGKNENAFKAISGLYEKIDAYNKKAGYHITSINEILWFYQFIIVAKNNLPIVLNSYATDLFYEQLFDTIFNNNQWEHFKNNVSNIELSLEELDQLIEARYEWEYNWYSTAEDMCAYMIIEHSRYGRYADLLPVLFIFAKINCNRFDFVKKLAKVFFIYSVRFQKAIYEIHNWTYELIKEIIKGSSGENILLKITNKIGNEALHNNGYYDLNWFLAEHLTENAKRKNLICRLSAMLEEDYTTTAEEKITRLKNSLWETPIDIEHIQSYHDSDNERDIWNEWQDEINSLGNLMILEQRINRAISNNSYDLKIQEYPKSIFTIAQKQAQKYPQWTLEKCIERKQSETKKILQYLFE